MYKDFPILSSEFIWQILSSQVLVLETSWVSSVNLLSHGFSLFFEASSLSPCHLDYTDFNMVSLYVLCADDTMRLSWSVFSISVSTRLYRFVTTWFLCTYYVRTTRWDCQNSDRMMFNFLCSSISTMGTWSANMCGIPRCTIKTIPNAKHNTSVPTYIVASASCHLQAWHPAVLHPIYQLIDRWI